jgi:hypothetical protein
MMICNKFQVIKECCTMSPSSLVTCRDDPYSRQVTLKRSVVPYHLQASLEAEHKEQHYEAGCR